MTLPEIAIQRHVLALMLSLLIVLFGLIAYQRIGVDRYPQIQFPAVSVITRLEGANPEVVDAAVTNVVESAVNSTPGIERIESQSLPGTSLVVVIFKLGKNVDVAFNEVQTKVSQALERLPDDIEAPVVAKLETGSQAILWLSLEGDRTDPQLDTYARTVLKKRLETIDGVGEVQLGGVRERAIRVNVDLERAAALGVTAQDITAALANEHLQLPGGFLVGGQTEHLIKLDQEYHSVAEMQRLVVGHRDGAPILLKDVARVEDSGKDRRQAAYQDGKVSMGLGIVKISNANTVAIADEVKRRLETEFRPALPPGMDLSIAWDDSDYIRRVIAALTEHIYLGAGLAALVVFVFLVNWRATVIVALAIPVSLLAAVLIMYFMGYTLNTMTMLALLLLIGVVVDDAIVVLENIHRHMHERPGEPLRAAADGTQQVYFAVIAATFALVCIFGPVIFMDGIIGLFFESFAVVVTTGVLASLFVAVTLTPMLCSRLLKVDVQHGRLARASLAVMDKVEAAYRRALRGVLRWRWSTLGVAVLLVLPAGVLFGVIGKTFEPDVDENGFLVTFKTPLGSSLDYSEQRMRVVEALLEAQPEVRDYWSALGIGPLGQVSQGMVFVRLKPAEQRAAHQFEVIRRVQAGLADIPGIEAFAGRVPAVQGSRGEPLQFVLRGVDLTRVAQLAKDLHAKLSAEHPQLGYVDLDLKLDLPQFKLDVDRVRAASLGLNAATVSQAVNLLMGGQDVAYFNDEPGDGERYDVRIKAIEGQVTRPEHLRRIYLRSASGELVRADTVARFEERLGPALISRYDLRYAANFYAEPKIPLNQAVAVVQAAAGQLPEGYELTMVRQTKDFADTVRILTGTFALALVLLYMVLASQFNSLLQPFIIMVAQPLAAVGALFGLWLYDMTLNIYSMIGMVLLVGLVAKNSILLVDLANQLRADGRSIDQALLEACPVRLRPVLMTSLTIILAMMPAALGFGTGFEANGPLAVTIIGGMLSSTVLTLLVVPALYSLTEQGLARLRRRSAAPAPQSA
ncbi:efflux RND transporter permease subunit [Immundisolibacter sp.]|uniref:efflux RND transporter permease subunit n=1 Tax=Immundisolibacter sp. TaxID=1934948 RepID=UPI00261453A2|nr:efflux RND transporter permease subunit [Immundisolibacter sp.]MDD3650356.1 efflux RND transporter permease subunit [Immundisolibacter sp.]